MLCKRHSGRDQHILLGAGFPALALAGKRLLGSARRVAERPVGDGLGDEGCVAYLASRSSAQRGSRGIRGGSTRGQVTGEAVLVAKSTPREGDEQLSTEHPATGLAAPGLGHDPDRQAPCPLPRCALSLRLHSQPGADTVTRCDLHKRCPTDGGQGRIDGTCGDPSTVPSTATDAVTVQALRQELQRPCPRAPSGDGCRWGSRR